MSALGSLDDREALLHQARDLRTQHRPTEALAVLARLETLQPTFSRLYQERGQCLVELHQAPGAIAALETAVRLSPTLPAAWDLLEQLYRLRGDPARAAAAAQHLAVLRQLPVEVVMASCLLADGDLDPAGEIIGAYLLRDPDNGVALRLLARIRLDAGDPAQAATLLQRVLARTPDDAAARFDLAMVLLRQETYAAARRETGWLIAAEPDNRDYLKQHGLACIGLGDHAAVIDLYARLLAAPNVSDTEVSDLRLWRANALKTTGRVPEAVADYRASLAARPDNAVAWFSLANLKTYRFSDAEITRMEADAARPDAVEMDQVYLCFALGKALEDRRDFAASWRWYDRGNALRRRSARDRPEVADACVAALRRTFTRAAFAARPGHGADDPAPIFIVGLPRSGSTLVEQILASHSQVEGTQELNELSRYSNELCGADPDGALPLRPEACLDLTAAQARALGARFLSDTRAYRQTGRPRFIDKAPHNFWHIGLIQLILPRATIIDVRREPMACGFSNYKQLFGGTYQAYTYGLDLFARRYRAYQTLMDHWDAVLPGRVLRLPYEDLVTDLEGQVRRLLDHCGLAFEPACLQFHATERSVRTPSAEQVRQPISREGLDHWRSYAPWLGPLRDGLGAARPPGDLP